MKGEGGYSLLELILVIAIVGYLFSVGAKYYVEHIDAAEETVIEVVSDQFAAVLSVVHAKGIAMGRNKEANSAKSAYVELENTKIYLNEYGWPANTSAQHDPGTTNQTALECYQLWMALFQNPPVASIQTEEKIKGARYFISVSDDLHGCRYTLNTQPVGTHFQ